MLLIGNSTAFNVPVCVSCRVNSFVPAQRYYSTLNGCFGFFDDLELVSAVEYTSTLASTKGRLHSELLSGIVEKSRTSFTTSVMEFLQQTAEALVTIQFV
jgi:hypothetical protein